MSNDICRHEEQVTAAARSGEWVDALRAHVENCPLCSKTRAVADFMNFAADSLGRHEPAPDPTTIWIKAALARACNPDRREQRARLAARSVTGLATALTGWACMQWILPALAAEIDMLAIAGASLAFTLVVVYFAAYRPLQHAL